MKTLRKNLLRQQGSAALMTCSKDGVETTEPYCDPIVVSADRSEREFLETVLFQSLLTSSPDAAQPQKCQNMSADA
jgi:hypothetical protein